MRPIARCPRGASLGELLAVLSGLGVAMAVATGLVHTGLRQQSMSRQELERDRTALRLARDVREDVRQAVGVAVFGAVAAVAEPNQAETLLELTLPDGETVAYQATPQGITRVVSGAGGRVHEDYVFSETLQWSASRSDGCVVLSATTPDRSSLEASRQASAPLDVTIVAALGEDLP